jgi:hypothetical protein
MSRTSKWFSGLSGLLSCVVLASSAATQGAAADGARGRKRPNVRVPGLAGLYVQRAILGARQRLADEGCRAVLSDFSSESTGRSLAPILADKGLAPEDYLATLAFEDGSMAAACKTGQAFAGMRRSGDDVVYICPSAFRALAQREASKAEAVVIHEMLHTLGLGENPPTSAQITAQVIRRCVDDAPAGRSAHQ